MQGRLVCAGVAALCCAQGAVASFVGGAFVTDAAWNSAASATIGQDVTVYRLYFAFDDPNDTMLNMFGTGFGAAGRTLFQESFVNSSLPPNALFFATFPETQWDSYVSIGALTQPSTVHVNPDFAWTANGVTRDSQNGGGWATSDPTIEEGKSRPPGGLDINGDTVIPASFDASYTYAFLGQFTLLGASDLAGYDPIFDGGFIYSDVFTGETRFTINDGIGQGGLEQPPPVAIGVPAPGGAGAMLLVMGAAGVRRRR